MKFTVVIEDKIGRFLRLDVSTWESISYVKDRWREIYGTPVSEQRLFAHGNELENKRKLNDYHIDSDDKLYMEVKRDASIQPYGNSHSLSSDSSKAIKLLIQECAQGLAIGLHPMLAMDGTGGTYFLRNARRNIVAVFKPADEEAFAPNNPRGHVGRMNQAGFRKGILSGESHLREVGAFLLDHQGFSSVPCTTQAEVPWSPDFSGSCGNSEYSLGNPSTPTYNSKDESTPRGKFEENKRKLGSLQQFVKYDDLASDRGSSCFSIDEVHKIAILDIRILNTDRNDANILVKQTDDGSLKVIPIDHGLSMPDCLEVGWCDWVWYDWQQTRQPLSEKTRTFVESLDIEADIRLLRDQLSIRETCLNLLRISGTVLKKGVMAGLNLRQIASLLCREDLEMLSAVEVLWRQAQVLANATSACSPGSQIPRAVSQIDLHMLSMCESNKHTLHVTTGAEGKSPKFGATSYDDSVVDVTQWVSSDEVFFAFEKLLDGAMAHLLTQQKQRNKDAKGVHSPPFAIAPVGQDYLSWVAFTPSAGTMPLRSPKPSPTFGSFSLGQSHSKIVDNPKNGGNGRVAVPSFFDLSTGTIVNGSDLQSPLNKKNEIQTSYQLHALTPLAETNGVEEPELILSMSD